LLFFAGLYGYDGVSGALMIGAFGALVSLLSTIALVASAHAGFRLWPHPVVVVVSVLGVGLYAYVHAFTEIAVGWWLWAAAPYIACLGASCFVATHRAAIAGAATAIIFDAYVHYSVWTSKSSTAVLAYIYGPLWNTLVFVPIAILVAWLVLRQRRAHVHGAP